MARGINSSAELSPSDSLSSSDSSSPVPSSFSGALLSSGISEVDDDDVSSPLSVGTEELFAGGALVESEPPPSAAGTDVLFDVLSGCD
jgi:hypothetical protein